MDGSSTADGTGLAVNLWANHTLDTFARQMSEIWCDLVGPIKIRQFGLDDSLSFTAWKPSDLEIVWVDPLRYGTSLRESGFVTWLTQRLLALRALTDAPILVIGSDWSSALEGSERMPGVLWGDLSEIPIDGCDSVLDSRWETLTGTRLDPRHQHFVARWVAMRWVAGVVADPVKLVVLDLDGTLYDGVLAEDGVDALTFAPAHHEALGLVKDLLERGVLFSICSKNDIRDVRNLFERRPEFPFDLNDLTSPLVGWDDKAESVGHLVEALGFGTNALLFVDDNPVEVDAVARALPGCLTRHTTADGKALCDAMMFTPGLWRWSVEDAQTRTRDTRAKRTRDEALRTATSREEYLASLDMRARVAVDDRGRLPRLADLAKKTNQFNMALARLTEAGLARFVDSGNTWVIAIELRDRFADMGTIALIVAAAGSADQEVEILEFCISCRALGRDIESHLLWLGIQAAGLDRCTRLRFNVTRGPRNEPALSWISALAKHEISSDDSVTVTIETLRLAVAGGSGPLLENS